MSNKGTRSEESRETTCERAIRALERRVMGIELVNKIEASDETDDIVRSDEHEELFSLVDVSESIPSLKSWLKEMKLNVKQVIDTEDDGNNDNVYYNPEFAKHFLRTCNLLPLWSAISCEIFNSKSKTSSSANVESYFKDVKHVHKDIIPCSVDIFAQKHIEGIEQHIITASKKYAVFVGPNIQTKEKVKKQSTIEKETDDLEKAKKQSTIENETDDLDFVKTPPQKEIESQQVETNEEITCTVCKDGNDPTGAHTCIKCGKNVHIISGCSFPCDGENEDDEGYGSKRICAECYTKSSKIREALNTKDEWAKTNKKKKSHYLQKNPQFEIMATDKKQKINILKNGNLAKKAIKFKGKPIVLRNTCAFDSLIQSIAGAYAYNHKFREFADKQKDDVFQLAILLAKQ